MNSLAYATILSAAALGGCLAQGGNPGDESEQDVSSTTYVDIFDFPKVDQGQWYDIQRSLNTQFDQICGDTFCEGDWSNITPLAFGCSVTSKRGDVHDCAWTFAASHVDVDTRTAAIISDAPTFQCHVKADTTATKLVTLLAGDDSLNTPLPGGAGSIYDQLSDCFDHPIGTTPEDFATSGTESYVAARDYYTQGAAQERWRTAVGNLVRGFDNVCGDTFCGGDYSNLTSLAFECSVTKSTGNVKSCAWVFGGSYQQVPERGGALDISSHTWRCNVTVKGTLSKLIDTLTAAGNDQPINRALPGMTTSAYDALLDCLP